MDVLVYFLIVLKACLFSTGGFGPLPSLHADLLAAGWAGEKQFTEALAVGQLSPGPNGLWVVSLSYLLGGVPFAVAASIALLLPPMTILLVQRGYARIARHPATHGLLDGIVLTIVGIGVVILADLFRSSGIDIGTIIIMLVSATLAITRRLPVNLILILAAIAGLVLYWR
jgi:chromate transporter